MNYITLSQLYNFFKYFSLIFQTRSNDDASQKDSKLSVDGKDPDVHETASLKDDTGEKSNDYFIKIVILFLNNL